MSSIIAVFVLAFVFGAEMSFFFADAKIQRLKLIAEYQKDILEILQQERNYNKVKAIIKGEGSIVEKNDKIKELVEEDN